MAREAWQKAVEPLMPEELSAEEREQLVQVMGMQLMHKVSALVYARVRGEALAKLVTEDSAEAKAHVRSPDIVFGHIWELCNE